MINTTLIFSADNVDWKILAEVYRLALLGEHKPEKLREAYTNSDICCFVYINERLIGSVRAISDGVYFATICDVVVLPEFQRQGIGRQIMNAMIERISVPKILLASVIGQEDFYRKLGFLKHKSVMARYPNVEWFKENGYLE